MKRLSCLLLGILLVFSLCACQQAAPSSGEAPDQQAITEEATEYFNQMMDGDFETFFNALPQGVQDNISAETIQETWEEEVDKLGGLPENPKSQNEAHKAEHGGQQSNSSEERSGKALKNHSKARHTGKKGRQK